MRRFIIALLCISTKILLSQQSSPWYHHTSVYQIYPRSFFDSDGDGIGDINGIIEKLDHIKTLGFQSIWCSPFFKSPQQDFGYDISDYTDIAPEYGTLADAQRLIDEVHKRDMKIVFDLVMNHTSNQHPWFIADEQKKPGNGNDFYVWRDTPNNWKSMTGGSGWHYSEKRKQYYWASFLPFQPDLNYRNPDVKKAMFDVARFWMAKGVDGFRLDIFNVIYEDSLFRINPRSSRLFPSETNPSAFFQNPLYTMNLAESIEFAKELRKVCDEYGEIMLLGEVSGNKSVIKKFMGEKANDGLGLVFNFEMLRFKFNSGYFKKLVSGIEKEFHQPFTPVYVFSNHDRRRSIKRIKNNMSRAKALMCFQLMVRGVPCVYYGEEIGMTDHRMRYKNALDPVAVKYKNVPRFLIDWNGETLNRDEVRTPMQWSNEKNAGFSTAGKTWLPIGKNYMTINVKTQSSEEEGLFRTTQKLLELRNNHSAFSSGNLSLNENKNLPKGVLCFQRCHNNRCSIVIINFSSATKKIDKKLFSNFMETFSASCSETPANYIISQHGFLILSEQ